MTRIHADWLSAYLDYSSHSEAPASMRFWCGVSAVAGALRRKVWIDQAYFKVMERGDLIDRQQLKDFETNLAAFVGTRYAVGLNSGYDALHISLRAAGIGAGDEVIVPAHTFVATCSAVVNVGATPVLVDVTDDFNIDVAHVEAAITGRTRAIIPVHLSGWMTDMPALMKVAQGLVVIEDACQSLGSSIDGRRAGSVWRHAPHARAGAARRCPRTG